MTIERFDANKTLTLGTLKKRAKDVLENRTIREKLGISAEIELDKFKSSIENSAIAHIGKYSVLCDTEDQVIQVFITDAADGDDSFYLVRTSEGFDLIPDPAIASEVDLKEYAIREQAAREALDDENAQNIYELEQEDRQISEEEHQPGVSEMSVGIDWSSPGAETTIVAQHNLAEKTVTIIEHVEPSYAEAEHRVQRIQTDADNRANFEARIEKAVTRPTPGPKRSVDGRIQQMLGVRGKMVAKEKPVVTNGGDPNCRKCAMYPLPCKQHGGARKLKAAQRSSLGIYL